MARCTVLAESPLEHPSLRRVEGALDTGDVSSALKLLAELERQAEHSLAISFLTVRAQFQSGKLTRRAARERLEGLLANAAPFPEAADWLAGVTRGDTPPPTTRGSAPELSLGPSIELVLSSAAPSEPGPAVTATPRFEPRRRSSTAVRLDASRIPRAGRLPHFTPPSDRRPSYNPEQFVRAQAEHEPRIRSALPPAEDLDRPSSLFEIAELADRGRYPAAIAALERLGVQQSPEHALLYARLLYETGRREEALRVLDRLEAAPLLDPELRAAVARQLIAMQELDRAEIQAEQALIDDDTSSSARITVGWILARRLLYGLNTDTDRAIELLRDSADGASALPAIALGARALSLAFDGSPGHALTVAQRALGLDSASPDALIAMVMASARLARDYDTTQSWRRLLRAHPALADVVRPHVEAQGSSLPRDLPSAPGESVPIEQSPWDDSERSVASGERVRAIQALEQLAHDALVNMSHRGGTEITALGAIAASFLTRAPVLRDFAPFDFSLHSAARVDAALYTLYGRERPRDPDTDPLSLTLLVGAYYGELLRQPHRLAWQGSLTSPQSARVLGVSVEWYPFELVEARIRRGLRLPQGADLGPGNLTEGDPWRYRLAVPEVVDLPWRSARAWPTLDEVRAIGRAMSQSVISRYTATVLGAPLDRTYASLTALDEFLTLIAPRRTEPPDARVIRRQAVLAGSYVGEVLRATEGAEWTHSGEEGAEGFVLHGPRVRPLRPIALARSRLTDGSGSLASLAERAADR